MGPGSRGRSEQGVYIKEVSVGLISSGSGLGAGQLRKKNQRCTVSCQKSEEVASINANNSMFCNCGSNIAFALYHIPQKGVKMRKVIV